MAWCLDKIDSNIFLYINGKRAVDRSGNELTNIKEVRPGRNADELWIKFETMTEETGRRVLRSLFKNTTAFSKLIDVGSNASFINSIYDNSNLQRSRKRKAVKDINEEDEQRVVITEISDTDMISDKMSEKFIGLKTIPVSSIKKTPAPYLCREVRDQWVRSLTQRLLSQTLFASQNTIIPVLVDPDMITNPRDYSEDENNYCYYAVGGNHISAAYQNLQTENPAVTRYLQANVYVGLSPTEATVLGNSHNSASCNVMKVTFQDKVYQARKIIDETGDDKLKKKLEETLKLLGNEDSSDSLSTVMHVARYSQENFQKFKHLVNMFEEENGVGKSIPQKLFRLLQGCTIETANTALQRAHSDGVTATANWLNTEIKRKKLQESFAQLTDCDSWEQARVLYPDESEKVNDFVDETQNSHVIPRSFTEFCSQVRNPLDNPQKLFRTEVSITYDGQRCNGQTALRIIKKYTAKINAELQKMGTNISNEERDCQLSAITVVPETQLSLTLSSEQ